MFKSSQHLFTLPPFYALWDQIKETTCGWILQLLTFRIVTSCDFLCLDIQLFAFPKVLVDKRQNTTFSLLVPLLAHELFLGCTVAALIVDLVGDASGPFRHYLTRLSILETKTRLITRKAEVWILGQKNVAGGTVVSQHTMICVHFKGEFHNLLHIWAMAMNAKHSYLLWPVVTLEKRVHKHAR